MRTLFAAASARRGAAAVVVIALAALALGACTTSGQGSAVSAHTATIAPSSTRPSTTTPASSTAAPPTHKPRPPHPRTTRVPPPASPTTQSPSSTVAAPPPSSTPAPPSSAVPAKSTCTSLTIRVLPGGASFGQQIAGLEFVNTGRATCTLVGYPTVTLMRHGRAIGRPSEPATFAVSMRTLRPGQTAESIVHDYTQTCQAPLSDSVRVSAPGSAQTAVRPGMALRACVLRVDKLGAPD